MTISRIYILDHFEASRFMPSESGPGVYAMIRISSGEFIPLQHERSFSAIRCFNFDDVEDEESAPRLLLSIGKKDDKITVFDKQMAKDIHEFVDSIKDKTDTLIVHCDAGISRSSATAWAIAKYLGLDYIVKTIEGNSGGYSGRYQPNLRIKEMLVEEFDLPSLAKQIQSGWLPGRVE